jgi:O-antigen/teichoic acid export membrane protein
VEPLSTSERASAPPAGEQPPPAAEPTGPSAVSGDAVALMVSTAASAALNLLFWVAAARLYPTAAVGRASAAIAAITLLAMFAQLNLLSVFVRFLPEAGRHTTRMLRYGYGLMLGAALALGSAFVMLGLGRQFLSGKPGLAVGFVVAIVALAPFIVGDAVLTALGRALWVPFENVTVSVLKLALLVVLSAGAATHVDIALAWAAPMATAAGAITVAVFRRLGPAQQHAAGGVTRLPGRRDLSAFVAAEYLNHLVGNVVVFLPPLLVLHVLDATASAYFAVPWLVVSTTQTLLWNIVTSFIVQSTRQPYAIADHARKTLATGAMVVSAGTLGLLAGAPVLLGIQGPAFAAEGAVLLRVAALSLPCTAVIVFFSAFAMIERRLWRLVTVQAAAAVAFLIGSAALMPRIGIVGVGLAYLAAQGASAIVLLPGLIRQLRHTTGAREAPPSTGHEPDLATIAAERGATP